ncbi:UDP-N-acetylmuramate:L-alanyl-gamma-D-glutamyl-meso-diaminopimelate ligase [Halopseudomonas aestusnigri]|jgi:UDP-N-acetylmuramate: L-alanyl-gamma-D-glutamyl-meso-diaminopimelate ligase|uniref:UDP-N-acetylmuramate:L-alanyl-gamma-D-glutamyl- meso-diaminopimelate ligase n=1 Tax=Halopseudomonas TaxID=2901189 RepID=UPI000C98FB59|nr:MULTISPECIES: UDP-N-acetylmuramate:L-alanyl-gamma-D-glutamyl-meso-diaminopimelate ligase [Halopseudomonas]MAG99385.1 UDP-N-acetylmuramate:L-alanyl-gamma-D-glutamyl-meso-diaminopimelate ligase [Pseudomonadales bacterium]MEE2798349.1 UDP-N-acetylmuramate:L-alanyl-gamma-D-glutamyl-meso-diaminopimelate ligase [Pseudomonadota bacterium]HCP03720.1 UDP-N-acetylmuramate:L-alanyl-gamma-D-glutamyl-meso-diaminopimelate ligase [Pseudomonas sp.]MAK73452.1 UDP-N-acetylmuramate:L-alanyl-gamma-D-glutamyl-me|tara:strand:+ start:4585 stop:5946 length:1362 start_codon:yes stop_codon:yes gene_type:complete
MHLHILGICGTFMGSLALLARELGHQVSGSDANVYPPMSTQLSEQGIALQEGYRPEHLQPAPDMVIVGNAMARGNPAVEYMLDQGMPYMSGPEWLARHVLQDRWVLAVAGTHGKTSTSSLLAWLLEDAGMSPGFLIGGVPQNFGISARLGGTPFFVVEADEYDSAFFDKRSKFVHYRPRTAVLNNLEFDHADIFPDLAAIERQFHHLVRTVPATGLIIHPAQDEALQRVIKMGCWTPCQTTGEGGNWQARLLSDDGSRFEVWLDGELQGVAEWQQTGQHSVANALSALAAARHVGVTPAQGIASLGGFRNAKRRMEKLAEINGISVYDDFAHHPTAIATTLAGIRAQIGDAPLIAVIEPRSNTMRLGSHMAALPASVCDASQVFWYQPAGLDWSLESVVADSPVPAQVASDLDAIVEQVVAAATPQTRVVVMSNGGFGGIHQRLIQALEARHG